MQPKYYASVIIGILFVVFAITLPRAAAAIGVSPSRIEFSNLANGLSVEKTIQISRANPSADEIASVTLDQSDGSRYIVLSSDTILLPKGQQQVPYTFYIRPTAAANGTYTSLITFVSDKQLSQKNTEGNNISIKTGVVAKVTFSITDEEVRQYVVEEAKIDDVTEVEQPLVITVRVRNEGNVDVRPSRAEITLVHEDDPDFIVQKTIEDQAFPLVSPGKTQVLTVEVPADLQIGKYKAEIRVFNDEVELYAKTDLLVIVHPIGTLSQEGEFTDFLIEGDGAEPGGLVKFTANIENVGNISISPQLIVEIKKNNELVELLKSEYKPIRKRESGEYTLTFRPVTKGDYVANGYFEYGVKKSDSKEISFRIGKQRSIIIIVAAVIAGIAVLILFAAGIRHLLPKK